MLNVIKFDFYNVFFSFAKARIREYISNRNYCIDTNEYVRSTADFYFAMESAGFERVTLNRKRYFKGVRLRADTDDAGDDFLT